jgi:hypothetical protein
MYFGVQLLKEDNGVFTLGWGATGAVGNITALYTPFYAGICIFSGVYLLAKIK